MHQSDQLSSLLAKINNDLLRDFAIDVVQPAEAVLTAAGAGGSGRGDGQLPSDFIENLKTAIRLLRDGLTPDRFRTLRMQCLGCCLHVPEDNYVVIGDEAALERLLDHVDGYRGEPFRARRLFDGLLRAYLGVDRQAAWFAKPRVQAGSDRLRKFLANGFAAIAPLEPTPDWVDALKRYPEVLTEDAGRRFAGDWLTGSGAEFDDLSARLGLSASSWLAAETLRGALGMATGMHDRSFVPHIDTLLGAAAEPRFQSLRDEIYAALLVRYTAISLVPVHPALRDALVAAWKNPWLARNDSAWRLVPDDARKLVAGWLKLDLIHQFFEVLSDDRSQDKRRFAFWRSYHDGMDDVYFALGRGAFNSRSPDMMKLKSALDGRLLELVGAGIDADNSAFIMCIGNHVVVEFSQTGNACYVYRRDQLDLNRAVLRTPIGSLKDRSSAKAWLTHKLGWEPSFAAKLREIEPKVISADPKYRNPLAPTPEVPSHDARPATANFDDYRRLAGALSIRVEDHRAKGGSFLLLTDDKNTAVNQQLTGWGFKYRLGRGWWKES